jgi:hypothetical protein
MLSIAQEHIVSVILGPDLLTEPSVDRSVQVSHEQLGCFYNIGENTRVHHRFPCYPGSSPRIAGIFLSRSGRRLKILLQSSQMGSQYFEAYLVKC